ncbi:MAG: protein TolQ, partial [Burkholderiales bacterium 34-67-9]
MKPDFSVIQLMLEATWVVQAVVLLLILASILSWAAIFRKGLLLRRVQRQSDEFERDFWSGGQLNELYQAALQRAADASPTERIFASGMRE